MATPPPLPNVGKPMSPRAKGCLIIALVCFGICGLLFAGLVLIAIVSPPSDHSSASPPPSPAEVAVPTKPTQSASSENTPAAKRSHFHLFGGSKLTKENYNSIRNGMTKDEVEEILGKPGRILGGKSEMEIRGMGKYESWTYFHHGAMITIGFENGHVSDKSWTE